MKRCSRCLLPETYPNIRYNADGVCNYCLTYTPIEYKGEEKLEELLGFYRDREAKYDYDCVVGVSGGRDSTSKKFFPAYGSCFMKRLRFINELRNMSL